MTSANQSVAGSMVSDVSMLLKTGKGADVTLVVGETQRLAHSFMLSARSQIFADKLQGERSIEIPDMREEVLQELLLFIYSDQTPQLASLATELLTAAHTYQLPLLKERCEQQLLRDINVENAATTVTLAWQYSCPGLKNAAVEFIGSHPQAMDTDGFEKCLRDNRELAVEICRKLPAFLLRTQANPSESRIIPEEHKRYLASRLTEAARKGSTREVCALLTEEAPKDARDGSGNTALHLAASNGHASTVKCLIDRGLDVNAVDQNKQTPLHAAAQRGDSDIIWMLVAASAQVDAQDNNGRTPLHVAAEKDVSTIFKSPFGSTTAGQAMGSTTAGQAMGSTTAGQAMGSTTVFGGTTAGQAFGGTSAFKAQKRTKKTLFELEEEDVITTSNSLFGGTIVNEPFVTNIRVAAVRALLLAGARQDIKDANGKTPESVADQAAKTAFNMYRDLL